MRRTGIDFTTSFIWHFACMMGWSPVIRKLLHRKRKSDAQLDEVEDGGRAIAIEEGIVALVFSYASQHSMLANVTTIDWGLGGTCSEMAAGLEVSRQSLFAWEKTILAAFQAWREAIRNGGIRITCDLEQRRFGLESFSPK